MLEENKQELILEEQKDNASTKKIKPTVIIVALVLILAVIIGFLALGKKENTQRTLTVSTISEIINIEELSTFTTTYKGIATVYDVHKIDALTVVKYYVAYEAKVNVGLDLSEVSIVLDEKEKEVQIILPKVKINDINVDMNSMDFMFQKEKYDKAGVSREAYSACNTDVNEETSTQEAIFDLAKQNAVNIITALVKPVVQQIDSAYTVVIK